MGIYIKIAKVDEKNGIGYYCVSTSDFGGANFYIGVDKNDQKVFIYELLNPKILLGEIDCKDRDKPISSFSKIPMAVLGRVIMRALKSFNMDELPEYLSYEA